MSVPEYIFNCSRRSSDRVSHVRNTIEFTMHSGDDSPMRLNYPKAGRGLLRKRDVEARVVWSITTTPMTTIIPNTSPMQNYFNML